MWALLSRRVAGAVVKTLDAPFNFGDLQRNVHILNCIKIAETVECPWRG
jgi:hypothetical protein